MNPARGDAAPSRDARMPARVEVDTITPRQRRVVNLLEDRARRCELLAALAAAGGLGASARPTCCVPTSEIACKA